MLDQGLGEALTPDAVIGVGADDSDQSSVDLQCRHVQGRPTQLVDQNMAVDTNMSSTYTAPDERCPFTHPTPPPHTPGDLTHLAVAQKHT